MPNVTLTKEQFIKQASRMFGEARVIAQLDTIERCRCGSEGCQGWKIDAGPETDPLFVFNPPMVKV
jgi:hypothetical protein